MACLYDFFFNLFIVRGKKKFRVLGIAFTSDVLMKILQHDSSFGIEMNIVFKITFMTFEIIRVPDMDTDSVIQRMLTDKTVNQVPY